MKKLFSSIIMVMMIALAFTLVASAADTVYNPVNDLHNIEYAIEAEDGTQFGMVVIEAAEDATGFELDESTIRYIDQVGANGNKITFDPFAPMELKNGGTYEVYIGGGSLEAAEHIGTLSLDAAEDPTIDVTDVTLDKETASVEVGKTVTLTATVLPDNATDKTVTWTASNAKATVDGGVVTGVEAGEVVITAKAGDKSATCTVTVTAAQQGGDEEAKLGDVNGDKALDVMDTFAIVRYYVGYTDDGFNVAVGNVDGEGEVDTMDAFAIVRWYVGNANDVLDAIWR